jgi:surfactin synthase thioesterase subunit
MSAPDPSLTRLRRGAGPQLVMLPYAGGSGLGYARVATALPEWNIVSATPPGHGFDARPPVRDYAALVDAYEHLLDPHLDGSAPLLLFGHSLGALAAYGLCNRWVKRGLSPVALLVSGCRPPATQHVPCGLHAAPDADLLQQLAAWSVLPRELLERAEERAQLLAVVRADLEVCGSFRCPLPGTLPLPVRVFAGSDDLTAPPSAMAGWREVSTDVSTCVVPGAHMFVTTHARELAAAIVRAVRPLL